MWKTVRKISGHVRRSAIGRAGSVAFVRAGMALLAASFWLVPMDFAAAHHVLGRPSYGLSADSNTPPSIQAEVRIGDYMVTYMVFPAFPEPGKPGRINLYITAIGDSAPFAGKVAFKVRGDSWLARLGGGANEQTIGLQAPDDNVYRQGFRFHDAGDYIITAQFQAGGEPYVIDFPLRVGKPPPIGPIGLAVGLLLIAIVTVSLIQRRRAMTGKLRGAHAAQSNK